MTTQTVAAARRPEARAWCPSLLITVIEAFVEARRLRADLHRRYPTATFGEG